MHDAGYGDASERVRSPPPSLAFALLYFAEGAPIGFLWIALPAILRERGADTAAIGSLLAMLALPWTLKFLWAPLVDALRGPRWSLRSWIVAAQIGMAATLLPLAWIDPLDLLGPLAALLAVHAVCAATQDVAIDALAIASVAGGRRGRINAWMQAGMLGGRAVFGGLVLRLREHVGDAAVVLGMIAVLLASLLAARALAEPPSPGSLRARWREFASALSAAAHRRATWLGLGFAATGAAGFEAVGGFAGPLLVDVGASLPRVGDFMAFPVIASAVAGGFVGGWLADRAGRTRAVAASGAAMALTVASVAAVARPDASVGVVMSALGAMYVTVGVFTASSYALFMDLTDRRLGSTQFSAYMGATNACESWSAFAAGQMASRAGYPTAFAALAGVSVLALGWLVGLRAGRERADAATDRGPGAEGESR